MLPERIDYRLQVMLTSRDHKRIKKLAIEREQSVSELVRLLIISELERVGSRLVRR